MNPLTLAALGALALALGLVLGYVARQSIARSRAGSIEEKLKKRIAEAEETAKKLVESAKERAQEVSDKAKAAEDERRKSLLQTEQLLLKREEAFDRKLSDFDAKEKDLQLKRETLEKGKEELEKGKAERIKKLETEGETRFLQRAKEIIAYAIQKNAVPQTQELTTTTLALTSEELK